ncbi:hypothetical protein AB6A40_011748 [Gnathostoma spinigerum]|uniref:ATPase AAA-type core domain-containing protein n=1 Tax=Gnathostoma spinigerum TaxID=75299 RepID=A0ABD6F3X3_9BILA
MNELLPDSFAYDYLREQIRLNSKNSSGKDDYLLLFQRYIEPLEPEIYDDRTGERKPIIKELHKILRQQYHENSHSRTIIFVTTRNMAFLLSNHLKSIVLTESSLQVDYITSMFFLIIS